MEEVTRGDFTNSLAWRKKVGLLTLDSLILAVMERRQVYNLASADQGFQQAREIQTFGTREFHVRTESGMAQDG